MSVNLSSAVQVFGQATTDQSARASTNPSNQKVGEVLPTGGVGVNRVVRGPTQGGHFSYHMGVTEASAGGGVTVWYSNLPFPDRDTDADWVQDTTVGTIATTAVASFFGNVGNVNAEWIRYKGLPTGDTASVWLYHKSEGRESR